jgi:GTP cyclohydrolase I
MRLTQHDDLTIRVNQILHTLGYNLTNPHFERTGRRVATWLADFSNHLEVTPDLLEVVFPDVVPNTLVVVGNIEYRSMCAHHLLPVTGLAWVGYLPEKGICGLSKLNRLVEYYATQLTVQERVTSQIADAIWEGLKPKGCMVVIKAEHSCMTFRGIRQPGSLTSTSAVRGIHETSYNARQEFLSLI